MSVCQCTIASRIHSFDWLIEFLLVVFTTWWLVHFCAVAVWYFCISAQHHQVERSIAKWMKEIQINSGSSTFISTRTICQQKSNDWSNWVMKRYKKRTHSINWWWFRLRSMQQTSYFASKLRWPNKCKCNQFSTSGFFLMNLGIQQMLYLNCRLRMENALSMKNEIGKTCNSIPRWAKKTKEDLAKITDVIQSAQRVTEVSELNLKCTQLLNCCLL